MNEGNIYMNESNLKRISLKEEAFEAFKYAAKFCSIKLLF